VFQLAEIAAECLLLLVGQFLVVEHQHGAAVHAGFDRGDVILAERLSDIDAGHLAGEDRGELAD
jgi:hypothetical protein